MHLRKIALLTLSLSLGAAAFASTQATSSKYKFVTTGESDVDVVVDDHQKVKKFKVSKEALHDREKLMAELSDLSAEERDKLVKVLDNLHVDAETISIGDHDAKVKVITKHIESAGDEEKVFILHTGDDDNFEINHEGIAQKIMTKIESLKEGDSEQKVMHFSFASGDGDIVNVIESLLKNKSLTPDQLNKIQALIDSKR